MPDLLPENSETPNMSEATDHDSLGTLIRVVEDMLDAFQRREEYSLPDGASGNPYYDEPQDLGLRIEKAYRALPPYRNYKWDADAAECPQCKRVRMQMNGVCEKCGFTLSWGEPSV